MIIMTYKKFKQKYFQLQALNMYKWVNPLMVLATINSDFIALASRYHNIIFQKIIDLLILVILYLNTKL